MLKLSLQIVKSWIKALVIPEKVLQFVKERFRKNSGIVKKIFNFKPFTNCKKLETFFANCKTFFRNCKNM